VALNIKARVYADSATTETIYVDDMQITVSNPNATINLPQPDTTVPDITLNGDASMTVQHGVSFADPGATADDSHEGDISTNIAVTGDTVNVSTAGTYTLKYNVSDTAGNQAVEVTRTVVVTAPANAAPTIAAISDVSTTSTAAQTVTVTATDADGEIVEIVAVESAASVVTAADPTDEALSGNTTTGTITLDNGGTEGTAPITYQWSKGGVALDGATGSTLSLANVAPSDADDYMVAVSNGAGRVESESITVTVVQPASIVSQPEGGNAVLGDTFVLSVVAAGTEPISYQWQFGGQALDGATGSSLSLANVEAVNSGDYQVIVSNHAGTESSDTVTLTVESPPSITQLTRSLSAVEGDTVEMSVTAVGTAPLAYHWSKGGVALDGATGSTLTLANVAPSDADNYMVAVSNGAGRVESESITVTVVQPASIVSQSEGGNAVLGDTFVLSVVAAGTEPISYQWQFGGQALAGATESSLSLADLGAVDTGTYQVVVQNFAGTATSDEVSLSVETPPAITQQPGSRDAAVGSDIVLSITAIGSEPLAYQWSRDGVVLPGATGAELALTGLEPSDAGSYTVSISNFAGLLDSDAAVVNVIQPIVIAEQPSGSFKVLGETVTVTVAVTGSEPISYQWLHDAVVVEGANEDAIVLANLSAMDAGEYTVRVTNPAGEVLSDAAVVSVDSPPEIVQLSEDQSAPVGGTVELTIVAAGNEPLTYQWVKDGVLMDGATGTSLALANLDTTDSGSYMVIVTNPAGRLESDLIVVSVIQPVTIVSQPAPATAGIGAKAVFEVVVTGSAPVSYQWKLNG
jgi:hypothetical protein